jgi:hypothetical protein
MLHSLLLQGLRALCRLLLAFDRKNHVSIY